MLPEIYQKYLAKTKKQALEYFFRPSKFGKTIYDIKLGKFQKRNVVPFRMVNTIQKNDFLFDKHTTFETEYKRKFRNRRFFDK
jgi:hypothetical protein